MNAWVLSLIICSATPMPTGDYCQAVPLRYGVSRQACQADLVKWRAHRSRPRLECIEDPALVAALSEQDGDDAERDESAVEDLSLWIGAGSVRTRQAPGER